PRHGCFPPPPPVRQSGVGRYVGRALLCVAVRFLAVARGLEGSVSWSEALARKILQLVLDSWNSLFSRFSFGWGITVRESAITAVSARPGAGPRPAGVDRVSLGRDPRAPDRPILPSPRSTNPR